MVSAPRNGKRDELGDFLGRRRESLAPEDVGEGVSRSLIGDGAAIGTLRIDPGDRARHAEIQEAVGVH